MVTSSATGAALSDFCSESSGRARASSRSSPASVSSGSSNCSTTSPTSAAPLDDSVVSSSSAKPSLSSSSSAERSTEVSSSSSPSVAGPLTEASASLPDVAAESDLSDDDDALLSLVGGDEFVSESAHAVPVQDATAAPMPRATARAPTRPMYRPSPMLTPRSQGGKLPSRLAVVAKCSAFAHHRVVPARFVPPHRLAGAEGFNHRGRQYRCRSS